MRIIVLVILFVTCNNIDKEYVSISNIDIRKMDKVDAYFSEKYLNKLTCIQQHLGNDFNAYYYSKIQNGRYENILVYVVRDSYSIIHLLILDENGRLVSNVEVAGGICAGPYEDETGYVIWCDESYSKFISKSNFVRTVIRKKSIDYTDSVLYVDTIKMEYTIEESGNIFLLSLDSIRTEARID